MRVFSLNAGAAPAPNTKSRSCSIRDGFFVVRTR